MDRKKRLAYVKKLAYLAFNGSEKERLVAPKILCGASLTKGWNIQVLNLIYFVANVYFFSSIMKP